MPKQHQAAGVAREDSRAAVDHRALRVWRVAWLGVFLLGTALRAARLAWQPLWWDEGYSIFFATESLAEMLRLTALDIHPPFYYALLHVWLNLLGDSGAVTARLLSVFVGVLTLPAITWATLTLWPRRHALALTATLLIAISPIHIFYSQEVRMYALALLLTLLATIAFWQMQRALAHDKRPFLATIGYILAACLALLTLYYAGFVLLAQQLWAISIHRRHWRRMAWSLGAALLVLLLQLPWWSYALPRLFTYVGDKVLADQDIALPLWSYLWQHWLAFISGHLHASLPWLESLRQLCAILVAVGLVLCFVPRGRNEPTLPLRFNMLLVAIPVAAGFIVNLVYPFFPEGGERLLLQLLPYLLIAIAFIALREIPRRQPLGYALLGSMLLAAAIGNWIYFTTPRYTAHDYRPIVAQVSQQGSDDDTVLALFPWQVGYWRAYSPRAVSGVLLPPQPAAVGQNVLVWDEQFAAELDSALTRGTLWFPMPLSFGSTLPREIETYLLAHARNLENHWDSEATRLTAWVQLPSPPTVSAMNVVYADGLTLQHTAVSPTTVASANQPIAIDLCWQPPMARADLRVTIRLQDANRYTWASRDLPTLGAQIGMSGAACLEQVAFNIPVGLPPNSYQLAIGVGPENSDQLLTPTGATTPLITIATLQVTAPSAPLSPYRLPLEHRLSTPLADNGLLLHGYSGPDAGATLLAGDEIALALFFQNIALSPPPRDVYVALTDRHGNRVASWQGWPLPDYPTNTWQLGALNQIPLHFFLPSDIAAGNYTVEAGFVDSTTGAQGTSTALAAVTVERRPASFTMPQVAHTVTPAPALGTHATLVGYDVQQAGTTVTVDLTWQIVQPLLPPHHIFVHLRDQTGQRIAQSDGEPVTIAGRAPTGSWLPGEYLTTHHVIELTAGGAMPVSLDVGLYLPAIGARLPVTVNGQVTGDTVSLQTNLTP